MPIPRSRPMRSGCMFVYFRVWTRDRLLQGFRLVRHTTFLGAHTPCHEHPNNTTGQGDRMSNRRPAKKSPKEALSTDPEWGTPPTEATSSAILQSLAEVKGYLAEEIKRTAAEVKAEIAAIGVRTSHVEKKLDVVVEAHNTAATLTNKLLTHMTELELELEDISNRSRRNNLRIRGLPESIEEADLEKILIECFKHSLPAIPDHLWVVDRVHRALRARGPKNSPPRDVIMRLHYYKTKEAILRHSRAQAYEPEGNTIQIYQDIALATLLQRKEWKPVTDLLRTSGVRFAWGYPFKILVFNSPKPTVLLPSMNIPAFLADLGIDLASDFQAPPANMGTLSLIEDTEETR
ncbi:Hypothetical predicted protein [Pelobates cultripes]|uniref:Transposase element L1Md-A101/L1Md-A102/L1Md-A2 n=1 Tax=Pelobates cultripes TaxID=61616 RepID=A0AAD1SDW7_PELCU|nr:Hypothetical predicted protein [Pelobates cultripes]